ncbi:hypothetical protein BGZ50_003295 [Haplosporangium sp. Z 11]|nr:hypothetical protein BGZ50_003295 [Haplosporangium sp. Z 11]
MAHLTLFCLVDREPTSRAFSVKIASDDTVDDLRKLIKTKNVVKFKDQVSIPDDNQGSTITIDALDDKTGLNNPRTRLSKLFSEDPDDNTYIMVQRPPQDMSPALCILMIDILAHLEFMPKNKRIRITEDWKPYKASNGESVDLSLSWIEFLESAEFEPEPREAFKHLKNELKAGQTIDIPNMGQVPKEFERRNSKHKFFVTEQMLELWKDICSEQNRTYKRVLSGPMGVGKSYLSYFLAARAYAEGWPVLYISDAGKLDTENQEQSVVKVVKRFLAINKDILTAAELGKLVDDYNGKYDISINAIYKAVRTGSLCAGEIQVIESSVILFLVGEDATWSRLIMEILEESYRVESVVFVGPLSETVFLKLLDTYPRLNLPDIKDEVKAITNCVPRELVHLSSAVEHFPDPISVNDFQKWMKRRTKDFLSIAKMYYESRNPFMKNDFYKTLL